MYYLVHFAAPVRYLSGHSHQRDTTCIPVAGAPNEAAAIRHAIRTTQGDAEISKVEQVEKSAIYAAAPPAVEVETVIGPGDGQVAIG